MKAASAEAVTAERLSVAGPYHLEISEVIEEAEDVRSFVLDIPAQLSDMFRYNAGQFLTVEIEELRRCYSLSSSPEIDRKHKITVKRIPGGRVSNWLHNEVRSGRRIPVHPPSGQFVLRDGSSPIVLFAGGSGITPIISIAKWALARTQRRVRLVFANHSARSIVFAEELRRLEASYSPRFDVVHQLSEAGGRLTATSLRALTKGWDGAECYACGPDPLVKLIEETLRASEGYRLFIEKFGNPISALQNPPRSLGSNDNVLGMCDLVITEERTQHHLSCHRDETILAAMRRNGLYLPSGCESGFCGACVAKITSGRVEMDCNHALSDGDVAAGYVLTCQARPTTPHCSLCIQKTDKEVVAAIAGSPAFASGIG